MKVAKTFKVQVKKDHLRKVAAGKPKTGLCELIWNSFDADATEVNINFIEGALGVEKVVISDNGTGIAYSDAEKLFVGLGGSWKGKKQRTDKGRFLHGQEGQGRFKAFTLGRIVDWKVVYREDNKFYRYTIEGCADALDEFSLSPKQESQDRRTGVTVEINEINKNFHILDEEAAVRELAPIFALYLRNYKDISLNINGKKIDPREAIKSTIVICQPELLVDGKKHKVDVEIVEWIDILDREIWFSDANGFPLESYEKQIKIGVENGFSAYIRSDYFRELHNEGFLSLRDLENNLNKCCKFAIDSVKEHFLNIALEDARTQIDEWKNEDIYPFKGEPGSSIENVERKVFDIVAVNINKSLPEFKGSTKKSKEFQLRMLKQAIEKSPGDLQTIMTEVLNLPKRTREHLADLLQETSLTSIINASKVVSDRIKFIHGLEQLIYNYKNNLKERTQLHRILAKNTWVFGDAFTLSVDDQSLTEVLKKHSHCLGEDVVVNDPVLRVDGRRGIVDLMLSRQMPRNRANELEHLVVELKKPTVDIGKNEIDQIKSYAFAVAKDERFRSLKTKWDFWVISNDYDEHAEMELDNDAFPDGIIYKTTKRQDITIWVKTWSELIAENKHRLEFLRDKLNFNIDKDNALNHLKVTYSEYVQGVVLDEENPSNEFIKMKSGVS